MSKRTTGYIVARIYGKEGCGKCEAAADKCERLGLQVEWTAIADHLEAHENWRHDGSVSVRAAYALWGPTLPIVHLVRADGTGRWADYPGAMRVLKGGQA